MKKVGMTDDTQVGTLQRKTVNRTWWQLMICMYTTMKDVKELQKDRYEQKVKWYI